MAASDAAVRVSLKFKSRIALPDFPKVGLMA
jgi:hypothetical protein